MWTRLKSAFFEQAIVPVYNFWGWLLNKFGFFNKLVEDPEKKWPYGHKFDGKIFYFEDENQLGLESRFSRKCREKKDD